MEGYKMRRHSLIISRPLSSEQQDELLGTKHSLRKAAKFLQPAADTKGKALSKI